MAEIIPARVIYTEHELRSILTTALEGGIGYWSEADKIVRDDDLSVISVNLHGTEETAEDFYPRHVKATMLQQAIDHIVADRENVNLRSDIVRAICSGDPGNIDADGADAIVQFLLFGELVYG